MCVYAADECARVLVKTVFFFFMKQDKCTIAIVGESTR